MTAHIIPFIKPAAPEQKCSFCGCAERNTNKMFSNGLAGREGKAICANCVAHAAKRVVEETVTNDVTR